MFAQAGGVRAGFGDDVAPGMGCNGRVRWSAGGISCEGPVPLTWGPWFALVVACGSGSNI